MRWEDLTAPQFAQAVKDVHGVCLLPMGVMEKHGEHLPVGTDHFSARATAEAVAEIEPVMVFPAYYFGQILEGRHQPGAVALSPRLIFDLLEEVCDEIARNGLGKIVLLSSHGGNYFFVRYFAQAMLYKRKDFVAYVPNGDAYMPFDSEQWQAMKEEETDSHAGESETSRMLHIREDLVSMDAFAGDGKPRLRGDQLPEAFTGFNWYANFPDHYAGKGRSATAEKGRFISEWTVPRLAKIIRAIKDDILLPELAGLFHAQAQDPLNTPRDL